MDSLDKDVVNLAKSIRQVESGGNFQARGKSGEFGAYQFMPATWDGTAKKYGVNVPLDQATPQQQNEVAYRQIKEWKDKGLNPGQIASMWNSGKPEAYLDHSFKGTNKYGAQYDVPNYAKKVAETYQSFKGQPTSLPPTPGSPNTPGSIPGVASAQAQTMPGQEPQEEKGFLRKAADFAFPILGDVKDIIEGDNKKTGKQLIGDAALSAMWFVPGLGAAGNLATKAGGGILSKAVGAGGAKLIGSVAAGAAAGYGSDVASGLAEGETIKEAVKPGLGTVVGGATGGVLNRLGQKYSSSKIIEKTARGNEEALGATKTGAKLLAKSAKQGKTPGAFLAKKGINLRQLVDPKTIKYDTVATQNKIWEDVNRLEEIGSEALAQTGVSVKLKDVSSKILQTIKDDDNLQKTLQVPEALDFAKKIMSAAKQQFGDKIPLDVLNKIKQGQWKLSKFDATKPGFAPELHRLIGNAFKNVIEEESEKAGLTGIKEFNQYLGSHLDSIGALEKIHGNAAKGGRLGDLLQRQAFQTAGGVTGFFGGGPVGALLGALVSGYVGDAASGATRKIMSGPLRQVILDKAKREDPEAVQKILSFLGKQSGNVAPLIRNTDGLRTGLPSQALIKLGGRVGANQ